MACCWPGLLTQDKTKTDFNQERENKNKKPRNQHQAIEGKTPTMNFINQSNCKTILNPRFFTRSSKTYYPSKKMN